jgi:calcium-dependent phosphoinositide phospholipase C
MKVGEEMHLRDWKMAAIAGLALGASIAMLDGQELNREQNLKLNQIQVIGTHNSYHAGIAPSESELWRQKDPQGFAGLDYRHAPLKQQLDAGVRQIELDIFADSQGGRYAHPAGPQMVAAAHLPPDPPFDSSGVMLTPGFKVMHMQDVDYRSVCQPFVACLQEVRRWSHAHPQHIPIFILVETKQGNVAGSMKLAEAQPFTPAVFDALDAEIRSVFPADEMITPDDVRGRYATLNGAILAGNWPTLKRARGKVVFLMDQRWAEPVYLEGHPSLRGRVLFTNAAPGEPDAAFTECNDGPADLITGLVRKGYLVRTRADDSTREALTDDTKRRDAMLSSGAQIVSTDYPASEPALWPGHYSVSLPGNADARCNPVNAPAGCGAR